MRRTGVVIATLLVSFLAGAAYGVAGTVSHSFTWLALPVGLVLSLVGIAALLIAVRVLVGSRWTTLAAGLGAVAVTLVLSGTGPGGSVIVPDDIPALVWTIAVPVLVALAVAWPDMRASRRVAPSGPAEPAR